MSFVTVWLIVGLVIIWLTPLALVEGLALRRGIHTMGGSTWMGLLTFFFPILALVFIPILLFRKPDVEEIRKRLENPKRAPIVKLFRGGPQHVEVGPEQIAQATSLNPWIRDFILAILWPIIWPIGLQFGS